MITYKVDIEIISRTRAIIRHPADKGKAIVIDSDGLTLCEVGTEAETGLLSAAEESDDCPSISETLYEWMLDLDSKAKGETNE